MAVPQNPGVTTNETKSYTPQIKVVVYAWVNNDPERNAPNSELNRSERLDISSEIMSFSFSKTLSNPAGSFNFTLPNTRDWKDLIKPSTWVVIKLTQNGDLLTNPEIGPPPPQTQPIEEALKTVCVGYIDRVAAVSELGGDKGEFDVTYQISGRDFGVVYADAVTWQNIFAFDQILLRSRGVTGFDVLGTVKINEALDILHDLILYPSDLKGANSNDQNSMASIGLQWLLPRELVADVFHNARNFGGETFWGNIPGVKQFAETEASLSIETPSAYLFGGLWGNLMGIAVPELHELYTELNEVGEPRINFRPQPFAIDKTGYPVQGRLTQFYKDVDFVEIPSSEVFSFDVGEGNLERMNSFLVTVNTTQISTENNISILTGSGFPFHNFSSIRRNGFRPMHIKAHALVKNTTQDNGTSDVKLLREFNHFLQDVWERMHFAESGSVSVVGNNEVKVGKCVEFDANTPNLSGRRYYTEGYAHTFVVGENGAREWTTLLFLSHGYEKKDLLTNAGFGRRDAGLIRSGEFTKI